MSWISELIAKTDSLLWDIGFHERKSSSTQVSFREKRGLSNFRGLVSKSLFGVATERDVQHINKNMENAEEKLHSMGKIINEVYANQEKLFQRVNKLTKLMNKQQKQLAKLTRTFMCLHYP